MSRDKCGPPFYRVVPHNIIEYAMALNSKKNGRGGICRHLLFILFCTVTFVAAQEGNDDLLNQLYKEIVNSVPESGGIDSMKPGIQREPIKNAAESLPLKDTDDEVSERLKEQIEAMMQDAHERYDDAVKFIIDTK
ncbi:MAG: hypothetical protein JW913_16275 [Chitinispirillaceae bacterium]|nr:hypothetical protein [Chitinispirillaceae bacterium]